MNTYDAVATLVAGEATAAKQALSGVEDVAVETALGHAAVLVRERRAELLAANAEDVAAAEERLDAGSLDRLRLDDGGVENIAVSLAETASLPPLDRDVRSWQLDNGLESTERRVPVGTIGANFEARPNVAADVASQVLKSGNTVVLRTGGAALRTVTALVDGTIRPAPDSAGIPPAAVGLVRTPERVGAEALVSLPELIPLVILRGSGPSTAALARLAAENGVRTLAHAEGGGVLYVHAAADRAKAEALTRASIDRLGVCNRLNLALVDAVEDAEALVRIFREHGLEVRATERAYGLDGVELLDERIGHEWASDPERVSTVTIDLVDGLDDALRIANDDTSGLAATIVTEDEAAAQAFLDGYRGTASFWNAPTRFTDGFALLGTPETGINVDHVPGPRGPVTYRDLWLRQYRVVGDGTQHR